MKLSDISYLNDKGEDCDFYIKLPTVETYGPYPQYKYDTSSKSPEDINGYTISYANEEACELFQKIKKICSKKVKKSNIKLVFTTN